MQCQLVVAWPFDSKLIILVGFLIIKLTFCTQSNCCSSWAYRYILLEIYKSTMGLICVHSGWGFHGANDEFFLYIQ
jgi:hypothetical protein